MELRRRFRAPAVVAAFGLAVALCGAVAASTAPGGVSRVRVAGDTHATRVVVELNGRTRGQLLETTQSDRVVLSLSDVEVVGAQQGGGHGLVSNWRLAQSGDNARLEISLREDARVVRRFLLPPADGVAHYRYVVDFAPTPSGIDALLASAEVAPPTSSNAGPEQPVRISATRPRNERPVIVIDAGHGGRDPGALGSVHREKDITLAAALALRERLQRGGRYRVVMTRDGDTYIPLEGRLRRARQARADLFISLHADAGLNSEARGASVYTLSDQGSHRAARRAMSSDGWFTAPTAADASVTNILFDLTQRATVNQSAAYAQHLLAAVANHAVLRSSAHRNAGFYVLLAPDVPAVLLEMGFVTNLEDERQLADRARMRRMMDAVGDSIDSYFGRSQMIAAM